MKVSIWCIVLSLMVLGCTVQENDRIGENSVQKDTVGVLSQDSLTRQDTGFDRLYSSVGQIVYVPVYSHIYQLNQQKTFNLTATLSFRNADLNRTISLTRVLYYDSEGNVVKNYLQEPRYIQPLASTSFVVEENDLRGGVGANFIVEWESENPAYPPVIEAVMISTSQQQGISFVSKGRVLENKNP